MVEYHYDSWGNVIDISGDGRYFVYFDKIMRGLKMKYQYYFYELYNEKIENYLNEKKIHFQKHECDVTGDSLVFSIWSNNPNYKTIINELENLNVRDPLVFVKYSVAELNNAKLLVMTPKKQTIDIINSEEAYKYSCEWLSSVGVKKIKHMEQVGTLAIGKEPSTKNSTAFWTEDTGFAELFTDQRVYELVRACSLEGIKFENVMNRNGTYSKNIFQVKSSNIITRECIGVGYGEKKEICHVCGKEQFFIDNVYQLHLNLSKMAIQSDLYMTERMWGEGIAYPLYIISQRFYQLLKKNKLAGGITISPVVEINE